MLKRWLGIPVLVWLLFLLALGLRLGTLVVRLRTGHVFVFDSKFYVALAANLHQGVFSLFHPLNIPETARMPGYPFLLSLTGVPIALVIQVILSSAKVVLVYLLAVRIPLKEAFAMTAAAL